MWIALALIALGIYLFAEGRLLRGPLVVAAGILVWLLFRRRPGWKHVIYAAMTVTLVTVLPIALVLSLDLYLHRRYASTGGYNIWGYRGPVIGRKAPGERRIAVLGGSTAFGYGVNSGESFPAYLERSLNELEHAGGRPAVTVANLGWNGAGAFSFRSTLEDYDDLDPDLVILYSGYNDLSPNRVVFRRESAVFRQTGYLPILPVVSDGWLRRDGLVPTNADHKVVFRPNLADRSALQATDLARGIAQTLEREVQRLSSAVSESAASTPTGVDCGRWRDYCQSLSDAVRLALDRGRHVVVVTEPYLGGGGASANAQLDQQNAVRVMIAEQFPGEARVHYLNMGRAVDLTDTTLCYDGVHLTPPGNARLASRLAAGVETILPEVVRGESPSADPRVDTGPRLELPERMPPPLLALGRYEAAREEARKALVETPEDKRMSDELAEADLRLGRLAETRQVLDQQVAADIDDVWTHKLLYLIGVTTGDRALVEHEVSRAETHGDRFVMLSAQADVAAASGRMATARDLRRRAITDAIRRGLVDAAAVITARQSIAELVIGDTGRAVADGRTAVAMSRRAGPLWAGALVESLAGNLDQAAALADAFQAASPSDVLAEQLWMPILRASMLLRRGDPEAALQVLESTVVFERGTYWPRYLRGLSQLTMKRGFDASLEFSRILAQPVVGPTDIVYVVAERQLARARTMSGAAAVLGEAYQKFFESWRHADPDLALVREVRDEYLDLRQSITLPPLPDGPWK